MFTIVIIAILIISLSLLLFCVIFFIMIVIYKKKFCCLLSIIMYFDANNVDLSNPHVNNSVLLLNTISCVQGIVYFYVILRFIFFC